MKRIGLIDVDHENKHESKFPNLALMKISAYHKRNKDNVEWYTPFASSYDVVYMSKVFRFTPDYGQVINNAKEIKRGGTGYDLTSQLPEEIDRMQPDYSLYPYIDSKTAYGFITRGCPNKCKWCVVPRKEGNIKPYMDIDEIAIDGRTNIILMDNNILACEYGINQLRKIAEKGYRIDLNQAIDARLITDDIAQLLASIRWIDFIRFGCDTPKQIRDCENAITLIDQYSNKKKRYLMYCMLHGDINECYNRLMYWKQYKTVRVVAQPYRDYDNPAQIIPQWQKDMARWAMRRELYASVDFKDFSPRDGFTCKEYFNN